MGDKYGSNSPKVSQNDDRSFPRRNSAKVRVPPRDGLRGHVREARGTQAAGNHRVTVRGVVHPRLEAEGRVSHICETQSPSHPYAVLHRIDRDHAGDGGRSTLLRRCVPEILRVVD